jgi:hypothetical protein
VRHWVEKGDWTDEWTELVDQAERGGDADPAIGGAVDVLPSASPSRGATAILGLGLASAWTGTAKDRRLISTVRTRTHRG